MTPEPGTLGPWTLHDQLGSGGNATVYRATSADFPEPVAVKLINSAKAEREPYKRFVREIEFLQGLENTSGVLPILAAHLPKKPTKNDRPWLAMPIAQPLKQALEGVGLEKTVEAMAGIAATLGRLAERGIAHRDLKPDNLFELDGEALVGDFGLVAMPEASDLTEANRPLGPMHYRPYEMLLNPKDADALAADVYALGKTLWVLATGQNYPPQGHQPASLRKFTIAEVQPHPHAALLDQLVDRTTRIDPIARPTMVEVTAELKRWLALPTTRPEFDLSAEAARLRPQLAEELDEKDQLDQWRELAMAAVRELNELFKPFNDGLKTVHPRAEVDLNPDDFVRSRLSTHRTSGSPEIVFKHIRMSKISTGPNHFEFALRIGRGVELTTRGDLLVRAVIDVSHPRVSGTDYSWYSKTRAAPVGSIEAAAMVQQVVEEARTHLKEAVNAFLDRLAKNAV